MSKIILGTFDLCPDCDLDLGHWNLIRVRNTFFYPVLSFCEVSLNLLVFELLLRHDFDLLPDCDLDLGGRNLNCKQDISFYYALSFCEVSSHLIQ